MANIITLSDFTGEYTLVDNGYTEDVNQALIDKYERLYLISMLGAELYKLFIADLVSGVPQSQRFIDIYNPFEEDYNNCIVVSQGIKAMLVAFVFYHIARESDIKRTLAGNTRNISDNSDVISQVKAKLYQAFNQGIDTFNAIQFFICENKEDYTEFNGEKRSKISWL